MDIVEEPVLFFNAVATDELSFPSNNLLTVLRQVALTKLSGPTHKKKAMSGGDFLKKQFLLVQEWNARQEYG